VSEVTSISLLLKIKARSRWTAAITVSLNQPNKPTTDATIFNPTQTNPWMEPARVSLAECHGERMLKISQSPFDQATGTFLHFA